MFSARIIKAHPRAAAASLLGLMLYVLAGSGTASADDRDLLRTSSGKPYVFIVLDTSGSMNWTPPCTQAQFDGGQCHTLCAYRDCYARLQADDPDSKTYQAKAALYEVLKDVNDVQFGFATYNQDTLTVTAKHWIYLAGSGGVTLPGAGATPATTFPATGAQDVFGALWNCDSGSNDNEIGCYNTSPADLDDSWETARMQRLPKGGQSYSQTVTFFIRWANVTYKITYTPTGTNKPGAATIQTKVKVEKCNNGSCSNVTLLNEPTITYSLSFTNGKEDQFLSFDNATTTNTNRTSNSTDPTVTYFTQAEANDSDATNTCTGWDANTDTTADAGTGSYDLRFPTDSSDLRGAPFTLGDVIPLDWKTDHENDILGRLAPNLVANPAATPDFRIATYFNDVPNSGESFLRLKDTNARPLIPSGSTPLGNTMSSFHTWFAGCSTCSPKTGWKGIAATLDPDWGCRRKYLLVITDGDETCGGSDPCTMATTLRSTDGVLTYVVGLGLASNSGNKLTCMATNGGTGAPIYPQNKQELIDALTLIFGQIREQASSFASAAVPTVQTEVADKIYISNFTPLNGESVWNGHIDAYLKNLPLTAAGLPDRSKACPAVGTLSNPRSSCHLWDAATQLLNQAPSAAELATATLVDAGTLHIGLSPSQRRIFYGKAVATVGKVPRDMRIFAPPPGPAATDADWLDLFQGFNLPTATASRPASATTVTSIMKQTVVVKSSTITNGTSTPIPVDYVLGDTFHADPTIIDKPADFDRYSADLYGNGVTCADNSGTGLPANPGYRCWADKNKHRRKMLAIAADDSQLHFFDAGTYDATAKLFNDGTGSEMFSYVPRLALPIVRDLAQGGTHIFGVDSTPRIDEVYIDTNHNGTPTAAERQWRSVLVGGFREGGSPMGGARIADFISGYYALDITQPDQLDTSNNPNTSGLVPSCLTLENTANPPKSGCGTIPFPALLWEFTDSIQSSRLDEDSNGYADLGQTWSVPTVGRIQIKNTSGVVEDRYVAIFAGGMDAENKSNPKSGSYLYILDIETGLPLYKHKLSGQVPSDPAVVDANSDGVLDTIYIGTTAGLLYKVDLSKAAQLQTVTIAKTQAQPNLAAAATVQRITDTAWDPFPIFDTGGKPIYFPPTVLFVSKLNQFALVFGTGDREDLWNLTSNQEGRAYLIVDENFTAAQVGSILPLDESSYTQVGVTAATTTANYVISPPSGKKRGWFIRLNANERVITPAFALQGLVVFSSYEPHINITNGASGPICGRTGDSRVFTVYASNANPVLQDSNTGLDTRYQGVDVFVAPPTVDSGPTKNPVTSTYSAAQLTAEQVNIMKHLKDYFPTGTKFGNFWFNVSAMGSDTRYVGIAAIPIGILERNWKEIK